ncbi:MAG TPA: TonB-dependent receptor, partial [Bacteroidota bacterium]|nr:TonB-dependent receptor [Bacteroidota bacterium]
EYSRVQSGNDINNDNFYDLGTGQNWQRSTNTVYTLRVDFNSQVHPLHLLKTGFEFNYEEVQSTQINYPTAPIVVNNVTVYPPFPDSLRSSGYHGTGLYPGYGLYRWVLNNYPNRGSMWLQDNIEFEGLNLHVGLRYDYFDLGKQVYDSQFEQAWLRAVNASQASSGQTSLLTKVPWADQITDGSTFLYYVLHGYVSPRLSIGYPVTDRIVFYFNYDHLLQFPERDDYYRDPFILGLSGNWIGNPSLKPQRTVEYESGFEDQVSDDMAFAIRAYYKDIFDYATLTSTTNGVNRLYVNLDYASSRGFEVTWNQAIGSNFSANATYTYQIAKGRSSNPLASIFTPQFLLPREVRLDWDQEHTVNMFLRYEVGPKEEGKLFGLPFVNNWKMSLKWQFGSGFPFTAWAPRQTDVNHPLLVNNETMPYNSTVGLSLAKGFYIFNQINSEVTLDVENLLNRRNVRAVYNYTGTPPVYGDIDPDSRQIIDYYRTGYNLDPSFFDPGRQIFLGVRLSWQ